MSFKSGKGGSFHYTNSATGRDGNAAAVSDHALKIKRWNVDPKNLILDVTNGDSGGYGEYISCVSDLEFTVELDHDVGTNPFVMLFEGTKLTSVFLVVNQNDVTTPIWTIPDAFVEEITETLDTRGLAAVTLRCRASDATWTYADAGTPPSGGS